MYKVIAFIHNASRDELQKASEWLSVLETKDGKLYNIPNHRIEDTITDHTIIITFGRITELAAAQCIEETKPTNVKLVALPKITELTKERENKERRQDAYSKLLEIKQLLEEDIFFPASIKINDSDLPHLEAQQVLMLEKITEDEQRDSCFQTNKRGKLIEISKEKKENSKADIHITFSELYTIRSIMDVLGVIEVDIVKHNKKDIA